MQMQSLLVGIRSGNLAIYCIACCAPNRGGGHSMSGLEFGDVSESLYIALLPVLVSLWESAAAGMFRCNGLNVTWLLGDSNSGDTWRLCMFNGFSNSTIDQG